MWMEIIFVMSIELYREQLRYEKVRKEMKKKQNILKKFTNNNI